MHAERTGKAINHGLVSEILEGVLKKLKKVNPFRTRNNQDWKSIYWWKDRRP